MTAKSFKKYQHEDCVVLLDDCFCNDDVARALTEAGFTVQQFTDHFPRQAADGHLVREQGVKDPQVLALAHKHKFVIFTTDRSMCGDHHSEFVKCQEAMIVATTHNDSDEVWIAAFKNAKTKIERLHKKQARPWHARISAKGEITKCETIDCTAAPRIHKTSKKK